MRIVGIGASAGGLVSLEDFFRNTPSDTGMAFLVVQHLDPTQKALLPELLQRYTEMPVQEARQNMAIHPNSVYVIPPNRELRVQNEILKLEPPAQPRGLRLPINVLFSSLASAQNERAIAVVLSGMGSDGTLGLQAIKATGGLSVVQSPGTAQFDAMPKSAIAAGCGDIVAPANELPARILAYVRRVPEPEQEPAHAEPEQYAESSLTQLDPILHLLKQHTGHDFSLYKPTTLNRRIERRMAIHGIADLAKYTHYLASNSQEVQLLFRELLIGVTQFFRDPDTWDYLINTGLPELIASHPPEDPFRAWVVGCSTGEEAYSLAMAFAEAVEHVKPVRDFNLQIFASDISPEAITVARRGQYPLSIENSVSEARLARFFIKHGDHYQISPSVRDKILFAKHDVILDPPFTKLDLVACRNLLIYFDISLQRRILPLFHYSLLPNGLLLLGGSETTGRLNHLFEPLKPKIRLYRSKQFESVRHSDFLLKSFPPMSTLPKEFSVPSNKVPPPESTNSLQSAADNVLLQVFSPAAVVLNADADIVYISGRTGKYLEPSAGKATWNIHAMAREGLREPLYTALKQAPDQAEPLELKGLLVQTGAGTQAVDVTIQSLREPEALKDMTMVVFRDAPTPVTSRRRKPATGTEAEYQIQVQRYQEEIDSLRQQAKQSREELQASNEELQSTNEELQSANEELTTSKEEMQSMNEELQTINTELQTKLDDLALAQSDMQNVLNSIEIAVLFLDQELNVRRYTERTSTIISLRESDIGRPLSDLTSSLRYPELQKDARRTLDTLAVSEKQITTTDDRWYSVRIMPYRRLDNVIDGVVITLVDITATKKLESALRER
ncbi:chemotaxis protein CheB [Marinobacter halophilus]|uniref:protein-glutamate O-methyltransferase n=1 Tax=Marinobacter halophilus TaxID=1323740 RepID=A0A2T1K9Y5_9GAMM|nr:chemotaxis protein CheB [Marinobacter halophilus]PSF06828.1 chemotaxis protein CheB [Marinobacter halophilus]GGC75878.1 chemotaxis protein CheR [Marinobacter halophilus]